MARFILRRGRERGDPSSVLLARAHARPEVRVLEATETMLLLEATEAGARSLEEEHPGWRLIREAESPLPRTRPGPIKGPIKRSRGPRPR